MIVFSVFTIIPFTAQASTANVWYYERFWDGAANRVYSYVKYEDATLLREMDGGIDDLYSGWYYSEGWKSFDDRVTIQGTVNIILTDSSYVRFDDGIRVGSGDTLNIYGQDRDNQYLEAIAESWDAAIGSDTLSGSCVKKPDDSIAPRDDRVSWCTATDINELWIVPCEHNDSTCSFKDNSVHASNCDYCTCTVDQPHTIAPLSLTWNWASDYSSASATTVCRDCNHEVTFEATVTTTQRDEWNIHKASVTYKG